MAVQGRETLINSLRHISQPKKTIASAATITLPSGYGAYLISGTTSISAIKGPLRVGRIITLWGDTNCQCIITHTAYSSSMTAGNIVLQSDNDFLLSEGDRLTLRVWPDGTYRDWSTKIL